MTEPARATNRKSTEQKSSPVNRGVRPAGVYALLALLLLLSVGALFGGGALVADPSGALLEMPVELLAGSPFRDYLLPGLVLFLLFGVAPLVVVFGLWQRPAWSWSARWRVNLAWLGTVVIGAALIIWILVQMAILRFFLQPILLVQGIAIIVISLLPAVRRHYSWPPDY